LEFFVYNTTKSKVVITIGVTRRSKGMSRTTSGKPIIITGEYMIFNPTGKG
jgi:hypothetical protein